MVLAESIRRAYKQHRNTLQRDCNALCALIETATTLKANITAGSGGDNLPSAQLESAVTAATSEFPEKAHTLNQADQAEKAFCSTHNLQNKGSTPTPVFAVLFIAIGVFGDAFINSAFLYNAHLAASASAALLVSVLISLTNATTSAFGGFYIGRFTTYGNQAVDSDAPEFVMLRDRAQWQFKVFVGVMALFILTVGLIRSTESLDHIHHSLSNYIDLLVTPEALFLVLINICMSVFAYHKGKTGIAHPYGDYADYQHGITTAREALQDCYAEHVQVIEEICDDSEDNASEDAKTNSKAIEHYNAAVTQCQNAHRDLQKSIRNAETQLLVEANRALDTQSVSSGKRESLPDGLLDQFTFTDMATMELPAFYHATQDGTDTTSLQTLKADALQKLSAAFTKATQP